VLALASRGIDMNRSYDGSLFSDLVAFRESDKGLLEIGLILISNQGFLSA
jgi:hypothetical protein